VLLQREIDNELDHALELNKMKKSHRKMELLIRSESRVDTLKDIGEGIL